MKCGKRHTGRDNDERNGTFVGDVACVTVRLRRLSLNLASTPPNRCSPV